MIFPATSHLHLELVSALQLLLLLLMLWRQDTLNSAPGQYSSALNCAVAMLTKEGPKAFYKGSVLFTHYSFTVMIWAWMLKWHLFVFFLDSCHRSWGWVPGMWLCLSPMNSWNGPWWQRVITGPLLFNQRMQLVELCWCGSDFLLIILVFL